MNPPDAARLLRDPIGWSALIALAFAGVALNGLAAIGKPVFDEIHYLPAARAMLEGTVVGNAEHPLLGKQIIALFIAAFGDNPWGWRLGSVAFGTATLFAAMRIVWLASRSRFATLATGGLIFADFTLLVQSRIAMLDIYMLGFTLLGLWAVLAAARSGRVWAARARLALGGALLGCAVAAKWNAAPMPAFAGIAFAAARLRALSGREHALLTARDAGPVRGVSLIEAFVWLGLLPLAVYLGHFLYLDTLAAPAPGWANPWQWQGHMLSLQSSVVEPHSYMSRWTDWVIARRPIWYFYEPWEGAQRGILLLGNPLTMLAGLPALIVCVWLGLRRGRGDCLLAVAAWAAALGLWIVAPKPVQFYYHYLLPSLFLSMALALALDALLWRRGHRRWALGFIGAAAVLFVYFHPILSGRPLRSENSFADYTWLDSWR